MKMFQITLENGEITAVHAKRFEMWSENSASFFDDDNQACAYITKIARIDHIDPKPNPASDLSVLNTAGQPAAVPPAGGWPEVQPPGTTDDVACPS
jgi:hypothetical protein